MAQFAEASSVKGVYSVACKQSSKLRKRGESHWAVAGVSQNTENEISAQV